MGVLKGLRERETTGRRQRPRAVMAASLRPRLEGSKELAQLERGLATASGSGGSSGSSGASGLEDDDDDAESDVHLFGHDVKEAMEEMMGRFTGDAGSNESEDRQTFVLLGGLQTVLRVFRPPFGPAAGDVRTMGQAALSARAKVWNSALVILRELCFSLEHDARNTAVAELKEVVHPRLPSACTHSRESPFCVSS